MPCGDEGAGASGASKAAEDGDTSVVDGGSGAEEERGGSPSTPAKESEKAAGKRRVGERATPPAKRAKERVEEKEKVEKEENTQQSSESHSAREEAKVHSLLKSMRFVR